MAELAIDPVTAEVTRHALESVAEEMVFTVLRTAQSSVVRLSMDFSTALCAADGTLLVQGLSSALLLGAIPDMMRAVLGRFGDSVAPGDMFFTNDPYAGGMHIPDVFVVKALHVDGVLAGFAVTVCHHLDMGGRVPGSIAADSTEVYQEGLRIPPMRLAAAGTTNEALLELIASNVRMPEVMLADLHAQLAACATADRAVRELAARMGLDTFLAYANHLVSYGERLARAAIRGWPDGRYEFADYIDDDGVGSGPQRIGLALTVRGDELILDFAGTAAQTRGAVNATLSSTKAAVYAAVRYFLPDDVPNNEGFFRPVRVTAPPGSLVNVELPGACAARGTTMCRVFDVVLGALNAVHPNRAFAGSDGGPTGVSFARAGRDGSPYVFVDFFAASWGARATLDGVDGTATPAGNAVNEPVELIERAFPVRIEEYGFVPDTGGAGQYRGGLAIRRSYRLLDGEAILGVRADRTFRPPFGLAGGHDGTPGSTILVRDGVPERMPGKFSAVIRAGDSVIVTMPGGGGYGHPACRAAEAVRTDIRLGKVSPEAAHRDYGYDGDPAGQE